MANGDTATSNLYRVILALAALSAGGITWQLNSLTTEQKLNGQRIVRVETRIESLTKAIEELERKAWRGTTK